MAENFPNLKKDTDIQTQEAQSVSNTMSPNRPTPRDTVIKRAKNPHAKQKTQEVRTQSMGGEDTLEQEVQPTPVFLPGKFHGQRSLMG